MSFTFILEGLSIKTKKKIFQIILFCDSGGRKPCGTGGLFLILSCTPALLLRLVNWKDICKHFAVQKWQDCRLEVNWAGILKIGTNL